MTEKSLFSYDDYRAYLRDLAAAKGAKSRGFWTQVALATGRIIGVEALLRWKHPQRGLVNPAKFIPVAERTGAILALGEFVISEACRQLQAWSSGLVNHFI